MPERGSFAAFPTMALICRGSMDGGDLDPRLPPPLNLRPTHAPSVGGATDQRVEGHVTPRWPQTAVAQLKTWKSIREEEEGDEGISDVMSPCHCQRRVCVNVF